MRRQPTNIWHPCADGLRACDQQRSDGLFSVFICIWRLAVSQKVFNPVRLGS